jgi:hypothetical protein
MTECTWCIDEVSPTCFRAWIKTGLLQMQSYIKLPRKLLHNYKKKLYDSHFSGCNALLYFSIFNIK